MLVTNSFGNMIARFGYDEYGKRTLIDGAGVYSFGYAGQYTDSESGLIYMRARYYDPETQQFISRDPSVGATGQPYSYAGGNPVNATDPTGHFPWLVVGIVALGIGSSVAADVGGDFLFDNANFNLGTSIGNSLSNPLTYLGAMPGGQLAKLGKLSKLGGKIDSLLSAASRSSKIAVIGRLDDPNLAKYVGKQGYETVWDWLGPRGWTPSANREWIESVATRRMNVLLTSPLNRSALVNEFGTAARANFGPRTMYNQEIHQLIGLGYHYAEQGGARWLISP